MDKLILTINKLHEVNDKYNIVGLDIPQIIVVGSQSSGKSSIMERITGFDILPKAARLATRCPILLQLINKPENEMNNHEIIGKFDNKKVYGPEDIAKELQDRTNNIGKVKGVISEPIIFQLYGPTLPTLTLIDLPGIIKNNGDLPIGTKERIESLSEEYASSSNSIILAVSSANVDLANSDSIAIAKKYDPEGIRTLNVFTKIDIMDKGTTVADVLSNSLLIKSLGKICVINRNQEIITLKKTLRETIEEETNYFKSKSNEIPGEHGIDILIKIIVNKLGEEIKKKIPIMEDIILKRITSLNSEFEDNETTDKDGLIYDIITSFAKRYKDLIKGDRPDYDNGIEGGAIISEILYDQFEKEVKALSVKKFTKDKAMSLLKNTHGQKKMSYSIEKSFNCLIKAEIYQFQEPSIKCNIYVKHCLIKFVDQIIQECKIDKYANLTFRIRQEMNKFILIKFEITEKIIKNIIRCEKEDIFCLQPNTSIYETLKGNINEKVSKTKNKLFGTAIDLVAKGAEMVLPPQLKMVLVAAKSFGVLDLVKNQFTNSSPNTESPDTKPLYNRFTEYMPFGENKWELKKMMSTIKESFSNFSPVMNDCTSKETVKYPELMNFVKEKIKDKTELKNVTDFMEKKEFPNILKDICELSQKPIDEEELEKNLDISTLKKMVKISFEISRNNIIYNVPKWIQTIFIKDLLDEMDKEALYKITQDQLKDNLLRKDPDEENKLKRKREELQELNDIYEELGDLRR